MPGGMLNALLLPVDDAEPKSSPDIETDLLNDTSVVIGAVPPLLHDGLYPLTLQESSTLATGAVTGALTASCVVLATAGSLIRMNASAISAAAIYGMKSRSPNALVTQFGSSFGRLTVSR